MSNLETIERINPWQRLAGWFIHAFTASGACVGLFALYAIYQNNFLHALWLMGAAILIDACDGMLARLVNIKVAVPEIDGALLDNIVDFFTYTLVPCFFLLVSNLLTESLRIPAVILIICASSYQFTQVDAKTKDNFFKGFPSYWNIAVFYLFFWQWSETTNLIILFILAILSFIPIKYVYPSRLDYLSKNVYLRFGMVLMTVLWGLASAGLLWIYPDSNSLLVAISVGYCLFYFAISLYRTWNPLQIFSLGRHD